MTKSQCVVFPFQCTLLKWQSQIKNNLCSTKNETIMLILTYPEHFFFKLVNDLSEGRDRYMQIPQTIHNTVYLHRSRSTCALSLIVT